MPVDTLISGDAVLDATASTALPACLSQFTIHQHYPIAVSLTLLVYKQRFPSPTLYSLSNNYPLPQSHHITTSSQSHITPPQQTTFNHTTTTTITMTTPAPTSSYTYFCCNPSCCAANIVHNVPRSPYPQFQHQFKCAKCGAQQLTGMWQEYHGDTGDGHKGF